jgi:hypothetical protein
MITNRTPAPTRRRSTGGLTGYQNAALNRPYNGSLDWSASSPAWTQFEARGSPGDFTSTEACCWSTSPAGARKERQARFSMQHCDICTGGSFCRRVIRTNFAALSPACSSGQVSLMLVLLVKSSRRRLSGNSWWPGHSPKSAWHVRQPWALRIWLAMAAIRPGRGGVFAL